MNRLRSMPGLVLCFLLLFPVVTEGKKKKIYQDQEDGKLSSSKQRAVQNTLDLSGYGVIDEVKRINLQIQLKQMIRQHNERQKDRKNRIKTYQHSNSNDSRNSRFKVENFNYLDIGSYGFINEVEQQYLEKRLNEMIEQHNLYSKGKLKRQGVRFRIN